MSHKILIITLFGLFVNCGYPGEPDFNKLVRAIYKAEGGGKAQYPYGIRSIKVKDHQEAKRVCLNTCRNNWGRWVKGGRKGTYLGFLADRYCPVSDQRDTKGLNKHWKKNVLYYYKRK